MKNVSVNRSDLKKLLDYVWEDEAASAYEYMANNRDERLQIPDHWEEEPDTIPDRLLGGHIFLNIKRLRERLYRKRNRVGVAAIIPTQKRRRHA